MPGIFEIVAIPMVAVFAGLLHLAAALLSNAAGRRQSRWFFAVYGIVACFTIAVFITPPDLFSTIVVSVPFSAIYAVAVGVLILLNRRQAV